MNSSHPSEEILQQYAISKKEINQSAVVHIEACASCLKEVAAYADLFSGIEEETAPEFDFNLTELLLTQLPERESRITTDQFVAGFLFVFACSCIALPIYLFRKNITNTFTDIPPFFIYAIMASTGFILVQRLFSVYKKYQNQMRLLNFN